MDKLIWVMSWLYLCERKIVTAQMKQSKCKPRLHLKFNSSDEFPDSDASIIIFAILYC